MEISSGILVYRIKNGILQVFLGKCGGPQWDKRTTGSWNIPKGHVEENENLLDAAKREFYEETSLDLNNAVYTYLGDTSTKSKKKVHIYVTEYNFGGKEFDDIIMIKSNLCEIEYPKKSGNIIMIPELSQGRYFNIDDAHKYIFSYQEIFLDRLVEQLKLEGKIA